MEKRWQLRTQQEILNHGLDQVLGQNHCHLWGAAVMTGASFLLY